MAKVNANGYILVRNRGGYTKRRSTSYRNFWIGRKIIDFRLTIPQRFWGKRIALKVVELDKKA